MGDVKFGVTISTALCVSAHQLKAEKGRLPAQIQGITVPTDADVKIHFTPGINHLPRD